ncbi:hypothetical protein [Rathayibacter sp. VKM Ac-2760]|uniref:hypothetical protein n=1 Tax=Rathayibacter sp. VKM Ac-2760 TaxID=2609253 RepID=UPI0013188867|nr:hypothetical protein [Rathayibacter sp. VKM Ac-2760]QHC57645.1 hypothetical protein GSU72_02915 [Rathayibacter sp. VKM Ac-2760]
MSAASEAACAAVASASLLSAATRSCSRAAVATSAWSPSDAAVFFAVLACS